VTFATGDATLTSKAQEVIGRFAAILNSAGAAQYELLVAGHTDNVPVNNPATIQRGHKNNWYLSSHRAISVGEELMRRGIGANRLGVAGYADQRPAASNATAQGKSMNRRVEVLILPASVRIAPASPSDSTARTAPANMNKDTASTPVTPVVPK
jgi:chemotaxis protein MotB